MPLKTLDVLFCRFLENVGILEHFSTPIVDAL